MLHRPNFYFLIKSNNEGNFKYNKENNSIVNSLKKHGGFKLTWKYCYNKLKRFKYIYLNIKRGGIAMKLAFISDIHGNANALDAVLVDIKERNVDQVYVLGDICYRGPEPQRSLNLVRSLTTEVIKGNADEWVVRGVNQSEVPDRALDMMNKERDWICSQLNEESIEYLRSLPTELTIEQNGFKIHAFHATPESLFEVVLPSENDETLTTKMMANEADLYIYAHIHRPYIRYIKGKCIMNIGSVGLPFDGVKKASYAIVDLSESSVQTSIVRVGYDINQTIDQFLDSDYPNRDMLVKVLENASL